MWLEVTVSRLRKGEPAALLAAPSASAHERARTVAAGVSATQPQEPALSRSKRDCSKTLTLGRPATRSRRPKASRAGCTVAAPGKNAPPRKRGERQRFATSSALSSRAATGSPSSWQRATASDQTPSWAGAAESSR